MELCFSRDTLAAVGSWNFSKFNLGIHEVNINRIMVF